MVDALSPVQLVQNPAFGSVLLWKFVRGYQDESVSHTPNFELLFLVLPLVLHSKSLAHISSTMAGSGLGKFVSKLAEERDELLAIHNRALSMRRLTLQSIGTGVTTKIISLDYATGNVRANEVKLPPTPERIKKHFAGANKLGHWLARLPAGQAFSILQVHP
jgi:hypothetical protein